MSIHGMSGAFCQVFETYSKKNDRLCSSVKNIRSGKDMGRYFKTKSARMKNIGSEMHEQSRELERISSEILEIARSLRRKKNMEDMYAPLKRISNEAHNEARLLDGVSNTTERVGAAYERTEKDIVLNGERGRQRFAIHNVVIWNHKLIADSFRAWRGIIR